MVQMKEMRLDELNNHDLLYIPHGSDESASILPSASFIKTLYIPHGSDERFPSKPSEYTNFYFISHMVQMKARENNY